MKAFLALLFAAALGASPAASPAAPSGKAFDTPKQASEALLDAAAKDDVDALLQIVGTDGKALIVSGDDVDDKNSRAKFVELAKQKMRTVVDKSDPHRAWILVGEDDWPLPVPLTQANGKWRFDSKEGHHEVLMRRIGGNELDAIEICRGFGEAQEEFASEDRGSGVREYARHFLSSEGKRDGLYWEEGGQPAGPIAKTVARAMQEGYTKTPYHGYHFRILEAQGSAAPMGTLEYVIQGHMIGGYALVAWPAEYRVSGVETFIVSHDGIVYQKDLGPETGKIGVSMERYNPDKTWKPVAEEP